MIITIKNDDGESVYDVSKIEDEQKRAGANVSISKIGTLNVLVEALARCKSLATFLMEIECNKKELNLLNTNYPALNVVAVMLYLSMRMALLNALVVIHSLQTMRMNQQER